MQPPPISGIVDLPVLCIKERIIGDGFNIDIYDDEFFLLTEIQDILGIKYLGDKVRQYPNEEKQLRKVNTRKKNGVDLLVLSVLGIRRIITHYQKNITCGHNFILWFNTKYFSKKEEPIIDKDQELLSLKQQLALRDEMIEQLQTKVSKKFERSQYIYVGAPRPNPHSYFKVGKTVNLQNRKEQYNTTNAHDTDFIFVHQIKCTDNDLCERILSKILSDFRVSDKTLDGTKEFYCINKEFLIQLIDFIVAVVDDLTEEVSIRCKLAMNDGKLNGDFIAEFADDFTWKLSTKSNLIKYEAKKIKIKPVKKKTVYEDQIEKLKKFCEEHKRLPRQKIAGEDSLASWCSKFRTSKNNGELTDAQIQQIETIPYWQWQPIQAEWEDHFREFDAFLEKHKRTPQQTPEDGFIGKWFNTQKKHLRNNQNLATDPRYQKMIESAEKHGVSLNWSLQDVWEEHFESLKAYYLTEKQLPTRGSNTSLSNWFKDQKKYYKHGKLSQERQEMMKIFNNEYGEWWHDIDEKYFRMKLAEVVEYHNQTNNFPSRRENSFFLNCYNQYKLGKLLQWQIDLFDQAFGDEWKDGRKKT
jgi:hypothetical protein